MKHTYRVLRQMTGDKPYLPGDTRELTPADAKHLVLLGVLEDLGPVAVEKAAPEHANKLAPSVKNKSRKDEWRSE
jgi:hypothetical protein